MVVIRADLEGKIVSGPAHIISEVRKILSDGIPKESFNSDECQYRLERFRKYNGRLVLHYNVNA